MYTYARTHTHGCMCVFSWSCAARVKGKTRVRKIITFFRIKHQYLSFTITNNSIPCQMDQHRLYRLYETNVNINGIWLVDKPFVALEPIKFIIFINIFSIFQTLTHVVSTCKNVIVFEEVSVLFNRIYCSTWNIVHGVFIIKTLCLHQTS